MISAAVREVRFLLPQTSSTLKNFISKTYPALKKQNPYMPLLIRECQGVQPKVVLRLKGGVEIVKNVHGLSEAEIANLLKQA